MVNFYNSVYRLGAECVELRKKNDIGNIDGLVLPGGESTVQGKLLNELDMLTSIRELINDGMPTLATCAGLILLAEQLSNDSNVYLGTLPVVVERNAYGRQLGSFKKKAPFDGIGDFDMTFIRAPYISESAPDVDILSVVDGKITGVHYKNQFAYAFHPELDNDTHIHELFLKSI